jgi:arginine N-succinyltransferase
MLVIRPIRENDLPGLVALARSTGGGITTLPPDEEFLADRIDNSLRSFRPRVRKPGGEFYLFALEDDVTRELVGVSGIASRVGGFEPWYSYEIRPERFTHPPLKVDKDIPVLHLKEEHRGPSEICSLFLRVDRRRGGAGRLLSLSRFLFIGAQPKRFTPTIIAEMRGYIDQTGRSPFWEAVGRHFFPVDFYAADVLSGLGEKDFIADLMPRHPIYLPLLGADVQAVVGRVHHDTEPALALLLAEGFARTSEVDIFDAGPLLRAEAGELRTLRTARTAELKNAAAAVPADAPPRLLANTALDFRATLGAVLENPDGTVSLARETASALNLEAGDRLTYAPLK